MPLIDDLDLVTAARKLAYDAHRDQRYGDKPYAAHLLAAANVLFEFSCWTLELLAAAWLHDSIEDAGLTRERIAEICNERVAELVWRVTDEPGKNRRERKTATYPKIAADPQAILIKLADRIANVRACLAGNSKLLAMYRKEYPAFAAALRDSSPVTGKAMWTWLDEAMKGEMSD